MKLIELTQGFSTKVDDETFEHLNQFSWHAAHAGKIPNLRVYAAGSQRVGDKTRTTSLHRYLVGALPGEYVDHKNGDSLDNQRENLRICTHLENMQNRKKATQASTSRFKGVSRRPYGRWVAIIGGKKDGKKTCKIVGRFRSEIEAARAYDEAARKAFGAFACVNFPNPGESWALAENPHYPPSSCPESTTDLIDSTTNDPVLA